MNQHIDCLYFKLLLGIRHAIDVVNTQNFILRKPLRNYFLRSKDKKYRRKTIKISSLRQILSEYPLTVTNQTGVQKQQPVVLLILYNESMSIQYK